jgi:hypothetical protein
LARRVSSSGEPDLHAHGTDVPLFQAAEPLSSAVANVAFAYEFYLLPVFFPGTIWLGLSTIIVGAVLQVIGHAFVVNYQIRSLYSPGVATAVFGWLPLGIVYVYYIQEHGLGSEWEWLAAIGFAIVAMTVVLYVIEQRILGGENPPFPFEQDEMERFRIAEKLEAVRRTQDARKQVAPRYPSAHRMNRQRRGY